jgi:hypothetical protein
MIKMAKKQRNGFKIWTILLSVFVAVLLFPAIVGRQGIARSLPITALAVGAIWFMYLGVGKFIEYAMSEELKKRSAKRSQNRPTEKTPEEAKK